MVKLLFLKIFLSAMKTEPSNQQKTWELLVCPFVGAVLICFFLGGKKFICQGIIFKFALDTEYPPGSNYWVYGGSAPNHEKAMKAACNELKGTARLPHARCADWF